MMEKKLVLSAIAGLTIALIVVSSFSALSPLLEVNTIPTISTKTVTLTTSGLPLTTTQTVTVTQTGSVISTDKASGLMTFVSQQELKNFISNGVERASVEGLPLYSLKTGATTQGGRDTTLAAPTSIPEYSGTNIQFAGVDEADTVKTDGQFIYLASENKVMIIDTYPAEKMKVVSSFSAKGRIMGLFVNKDRMAIFEEVISTQSEPVRDKITLLQPSPIGFNIKFYDISSRSNPILYKDIFFNGTYVDSRMIGDWVYSVANEPSVYWIQDRQEVVLPDIRVDGESKQVSATQIQYSNSTDIPVVYTVLAAINIQEENESEFKIILTGYATTMYASLKNIYLAMPNGWWLGEGTTTVYRISMDGRSLNAEARGEVPGTVLNQFSMDEYDNYFRVATTVSSITRGGQGTNNVYILDAGLYIVGKLEDLAPGEQIHSARFIGDRCYLVTFKKVDPLFTIDLSNPKAPKVLGQLKIPGYSDYLHPYDENYLIGIGKETIEAEEGDFAWYQGLKISLFDVSDVANPKELGKLIIGDRGTDSPVLSDHHAMLFDEQKELLVIPVLEAKIFPEKYPQGVLPSTQGEYVFQGAYVLNISPQDGITVKGRITHITDLQTLLKSGYYFESSYQIERSMYIGENLYTISDGAIKANKIIDLSEIAIVNLS
jgi:inhibitor of cysteine peptidase